MLDISINPAAQARLVAILGADLAKKAGRNAVRRTLGGTTGGGGLRRLLAQYVAVVTGGDAAA